MSDVSRNRAWRELSKDRRGQAWIRYASTIGVGSQPVDKMLLDDVNIELDGTFGTATRLDMEPWPEWRRQWTVGDVERCYDKWDLGQIRPESSPIEPKPVV